MTQWLFVLKASPISCASHHQFPMNFVVMQKAKKEIWALCLAERRLLRQIILAATPDFTFLQNIYFCNLYEKMSRLVSGRLIVCFASKKHLVLRSVIPSFSHFWILIPKYVVWAWSGRLGVKIFGPMELEFQAIFLIRCLLQS